MRVAVVSDIHGNLTALDAVIASIGREAPDLVLCGGDLVLMGAQPAEVVDRVRELGWPTVVGNTDELLWERGERQRQEARAPNLAPLLQLLFREYAPATEELLGAERLAWLRALPSELTAGDLLLMHAAPGDLWRAPMPDAGDDELLAVYGECEASEVVYGHIHRPYTRALAGLQLANSGSTGLPWDGDPRAAFLLVDHGEPHVVRVPYDVEHEAKLLERSGYPDASRLAEMRRRGRFLPVGWS